MRIYRVSKTQYIDDLSGEGARLYGGRWNKIGDPMLYFSKNLSLSLLEIIVHADFAELSLDYSFVEAEIPDSNIKSIRSVEFIHPKWKTDEGIGRLQTLGANWLVKKESLALKVPSVILPQEHNILVNPKHRDFKDLKIVKIEKLDLDPRLYRR